MEANNTELQSALRKDWQEALWEMSAADPLHDQIGEALAAGYWMTVGALMQDRITGYWMRKLAPLTLGELTHIDQTIRGTVYQSMAGGGTRRGIEVSMVIAAHERAEPSPANAWRVGRRHVDVLKERMEGVAL